MGVNVHFSNPSTVSQPLNDFLLSLIAMRIEEMSPLDCMTKLYEIKRTAGNLHEALVLAETLTTPPEPDYAMQDFQNRDFTAAEIVALRVTPPEPPAGYMRPCEACDGTGTEANGDYVRPCSYCDGTGIHSDDEPEPPSAERDQYRVEKRHYNPQIPTEIIAEYEMLQAATLYVNSLPLAMPYYYVVVDQKTGLSAYHRCPHGDDPKPTNHQIAADSSAPVKLSKAQRELLEKLDRGVDIRGYHYDNPRDMTFRLQSAKPVNLKTVRILESAGLIAIKRDSRDDVLVLTESGKAALKGAK